jgi:D-aminoacyl-tRNA deacylase
MAFIVYSPLDSVSANVAEALKSYVKFEEVDKIAGMRHFKSSGVDLLELNTTHLYADFLDDCIKTDVIIFLSRHGSIKNIPSFTVHPEGNWANEAKLGGKPKELSTSSPVQMARILHAMKRHNKTDIPVVYEATHHGPLLKTPSLYAEIGGTTEIRESKDHALFLAKCVYDSVNDDVHYEKVAVGIGGLHYSDRFTKLTLSNKYLFSHIMPRHFVHCVDMIPQAIARSVPKAEIGIIDWKSLKGSEREAIIKKLNEVGLDYEKI